MKKYLKFSIYVLSFVVILFGSKSGYEYLTKHYEIEDSSDNIVDNDTTTHQATDFEVINLNGEKVKLSDYFGKPIVVNFWATWCGPCKAELPEFMAAYQKHGEEVEFLMVNLTDGYTDTVESVKEFVLENEYEFPLYFDTEYSATNAYQLYSIPQTLFIDRDGKISKSYIGMINGEIIENNISLIK